MKIILYAVLAALSVAARVSADVTPEQAYAFGKSVYDKNCASCHESPLGKTPGRASLSQVSLVNILMAMEFGKMQAQAAHLKRQEKEAVAFFLGGKPDPHADDWIETARCDSETEIDLDAPVYSSGWGLEGLGNARHSSNSMIRSDNVSKLKLKWAFAFPKVNQARSQPVVQGNTLFVGSKNGNVFALDRHTGCVKWRFKTGASVRSGLVLGTHKGKSALYFSDLRSRVHAIDTSNGKLLWKKDVSIFPTSTVTGSPSFYDGVLYVPVSSFEVAAAGMPSYPCCVSHGAVVALGVENGEERWIWHATGPATPQGLSRNGTPQMGPSGVAVWSTPTIDNKRGVLYIGTAENTSRPATKNSDAIVALDLTSGKERWVFQALPDDVWNSSCLSGGPNCPENEGPDFDFGASVILTTRSDGKEILLAGQKSSEVFALDPDRDGAVLWRNRLSQGSSNGGVHWGMSVSAGQLYVPLADPERNEDGYVPRPGLYALDIDSGKVKWSAPADRGCKVAPENVPKVGLEAMRSGAAIDLALMYNCSFYYGLSAAATSANDLVFAGGLDGRLKAYNVKTGAVLWSAKTAVPFQGVNGVEGHGGAIDVDGVVLADKMLFIQSGYSLFGQLPGNVLLAFEIDKP
jgi:polyvinyl alcohol dehydrogenase (cytochrome)